jgi:putative oxidoreductase
MILHHSYHEEAATIIRVSLGIMWIAHALFKWFVISLPGFSAWLDGLGLFGFFAWPVFLLELLGGLLILLGYYGRYVSMTLLPILMVAIWVHFPNGWVHTNEGGGWEYPLFLLFISIAHILLGDGRFKFKYSA